MNTRLLLVDDDWQMRSALGLALEDEGCEVLLAGSGEEALDLLATTHVDLVVLDLGLPGMDGFEVCRSVRDQGDLPVVILSGRTDLSDQRRGLQAGADDYLAKPVVAGELVAHVRDVLDRRRH